MRYLSHFQLSSEVASMKKISDQVEQQVDSKVQQVKNENEQVLSDFHEELELITTRVSTNVSAIDNFSKQVQGLRSEIVKQIEQQVIISFIH